MMMTAAIQSGFQKLTGTGYPEIQKIYPQEESQLADVWSKYMPSDRYDCGNIDFCNDGDKLHSIKTLEDFMSEKILLIDGHSILNRAFYGLPDLTNSEGKHTGAVYGFLNILLRTIEEEKPQYLTVAFDLKAPTSAIRCLKHTREHVNPCLKN